MLTLTENKIEGNYTKNTIADFYWIIERVFSSQSTIIWSNNYKYSDVSEIRV